VSSTNGHGPKRAILYARVSTEEQARSGYSLAQQIEALREYAVREGYEVLEEVTDPGQSGASLERPGMDRVRDLVAAANVSVVLAQDRDRFAREPAYHYLLREELEKHGARLRALNDRGDDSPEGVFMNGVLDQLAKLERAKVAERTRRGKLRKAREGKVVAAGSAPNFGFKYNAARDNYVVEVEKMRIMGRIFHMVGVEKRALNSVKRILEAEGVTTPTGNRRWHTRGLRELVLSDVYRPYTYEEMEELVSQAVATTLDPEKCYGVWWFNRERITRRQIAEVSPSGRVYRAKVKAITRPREEWIAVPVPDSGIPRRVVDAAREAIVDNKPNPSNGDRFWELSGGVFRCGVCGSRMRTNVTQKVAKRYYYYICRKHHEERAACPNRKSHRADKVEPGVWGLISELLQKPERLRADLESMIEVERSGLQKDPDREARSWSEKLTELNRKRARFQHSYAEGVIELDDLRARLAELDETREMVEHELEKLLSCRERIEQLERNKDTLLESYVGMATEALDSLAPEERHQIYKMLQLDVTASANGTIELTGHLVTDPEVCHSGSASWLRLETS
jgi:site-specific DNA recombinase